MDDDDWNFDSAHLEILDGLIEQGMFDDGLPEDRVAYLLRGMHGDDLSPEDWKLYNERIMPLLWTYHVNYDRFAEEYANRQSLADGKRAYWSEPTGPLPD